MYTFYRYLCNFIPNLLNHITLCRKHIKWTNGLKILGKLRIYGKGKIELDEHVTIISSINDNPTRGGYSAFVTYPGSQLKIGAYSGISNSTISCRQSITIYEHVLIGANCIIADNDFHPIDWKERRENQLGNIKIKSVVIRNNVFIGANCIILKGVTIGEHSVIGAGSVVTHDVPPDEIWAGNPARFVKKLEK